MSRVSNFLFAAIILSLIFVSGCKDKPATEPEPEEISSVKSQPDAGSDIVEPEKPDKVETAVTPDKPAAKVEDPVKDADTVKDQEPIKDEDPVIIAKPDTDAVVPVEKKNDKPENSVVSVASNDAEPEVVAHDLWMTDYKAAMKKAAAEEKDMLLDFSGSDWCGWCIKLDKEVFSQKEFIEPASRDFVFVLLDFPQDKTKTTPQLQQQNNELRNKYPIESFPTVYLTDADGKPYAITGYQKGGPKAYYEHISKLRQANLKAKSLIAKADSEEIDDVEKAKLLDQALSFISPRLVPIYYPDLPERVISLDSENQAGLRDNYLARRALKEVALKINERDFDKAFELINKLIEDYRVTGPTAQDVYYYRAVTLDGKKDKAGAIENLKKAIAVDPKSIMAEDIRTIIKTYFSETKTKPEPEPVSQDSPE